MYYPALHYQRALTMKAPSLHLQSQIDRIRCRYLKFDNLQMPTLEPNELSAVLELPLFASKVPSGFLSPADDHLEVPIDLNQRYVPAFYCPIWCRLV